MSKKLGKKEKKAAENTIKWSQFASISEADLSKAKEKLNPPKKKVVAKKKASAKKK